MSSEAIKKVSIVIPVYNSEVFIAETLDSVLLQTYKNWECIIIDDGSTDKSVLIIDEYLKKDNRFTYLFQENSGPSKARNYGIQLATGDYVMFLDSDDVILPEYITEMIHQSKLVEDKIILYCKCLLGNSTSIYETCEMNRPTNPGYDVTFNVMYSGFGLNFLFIPSTILFPVSIVRKFSWNEGLSHSEDWDYYLSILKNNYIFRYIDKPYVIYRNSPVGLSKNTENTIKANYSILLRWLIAENRIILIKRIAKLLTKSIIRYYNKKSDKIIRPDYNNTGNEFFVRSYILLIYMYTVKYLLTEVYRLILKRLK